MFVGNPEPVRTRGFRCCVGLNRDLALATIAPVAGWLYVAVVSLVMSPARLAAQMVGATLFASTARGGVPQRCPPPPPWCLGGVYWPSQNQVYHGGDSVIHEVLDAPLIAAVRAQLLEKWVPHSRAPMRANRPFPRCLTTAAP
jgi:hypothetical protein